MLDDTTERFVEKLLAEKRELRNQVNIGFTLAVLMQQVAEKNGHDFGIPSIAPGMPMEVAQAMVASLEAKLEAGDKNLDLIRSVAKRVANNSGAKSGVAE